MAFNRIVIATMLLIGILPFLKPDSAPSTANVLEVFALYILAAIIVLIHIRAKPDSIQWRKFASLAMDLFGLSCAGFLIGPACAGFLFSGYMLAIYGFGFRYGVSWLVFSTVLCILAFATIVALSPLWQAQPSLVGGLFLGFIILPGYADKLVRGLWRAKAEAEESNRVKSMFVAAASHDLRTPLNAIIGLGDILAMSKLSADNADMARMISGAGRSLLSLVDSILELSQLEMSQTPPPTRRIDLFAMLRSVHELLDISAQAKSIDLCLRVGSGCPRYIVANERHIKDSLVNLVGNAIKFTHRGSVTISVACHSKTETHAQLRFTVVDTGIGISEQAQARIFSPFSQANSRIRDTFGGYGLGLAIVKQLVLALEGAYGVESEKGKGSTFWFEFKAALSEDSPSSSLDAPHPIVYTRPSSFAPASVDDFQALAPDATFVRTIEDLRLALTNTGKRTHCVVVDFRNHENDAVSDGASLDDSAALANALAEAGNHRANIIFYGALLPKALDKATLTKRAIVVDAPPERNNFANAMALASPVAHPSELENIAKHKSPACSILVAEDNRTNQIVLEKMLVISGHRPVFVNNGQAALEKISENFFDLVLMDINMPGIDGAEATRILRRQETNGRHVPVIALTADVTPATRARCLAAGMDDCINKPIDLPHLIATIERWTKQPMNQDTASSTPSQEIFPENLLEISPEAACSSNPPPALHAADDPRDVNPCLNQETIADLEKLGGNDFVMQIAEQFVADAALILRLLTEAVNAQDLEKFRDEAHALRSCSANIGAQKIFELCLSWRDIETDDFLSQGAAHIQALETEFADIKEHLSPYLKEAA